MTGKLNLWGAIREHWRTIGELRPFRSYIFHLGVPIAAVAFGLLPLLPGSSQFMVWIRANLTADWGDYAGPLTAATVLFAFFFAAAVFVFQLRAEPGHLTPRADVQRSLQPERLVDELFANCTYAVIMSGAAAATGLLLGLYDGLARIGGDAILLGLFVHIGMLTMMCLKRLGLAYTHVRNVRLFDNWAPPSKRNADR